MSYASFDDLVSRSVGESISKILGVDTWKAVNFYFDTKTVASNPEKFMGVLDRLFGATSRVIQKIISETLLRKVGDSEPIPASQDFMGIIQIARAKFGSSRFLGSGRPA